MILAERHPRRDSRLAGSPLRADWYQWIAFLTNSFGPLYRFWFYPPDLGSPEHPPFVREALREKIEDAWSLVDAHLAAHGPYMLGAEFSGVDLLTLMYMRWSRNMPKPVTRMAHSSAWLTCCAHAPSWKRMYESKADGVGGLTAAHRRIFFHAPRTPAQVHRGGERNT